jgi:predicted transcriptional regulator
MTKEELIESQKKLMLESAVKVLKILLYDYDLKDYTTVNTKDVSKKAGIGYSTAIRAMNDLVSYKILIRKRVEKRAIYMYMLNPELGLTE